MYVEVQRAACYGRLGLAREAAGLWEQILPQMPGSARRDAGVYRTRYAAALASSGRPDEAVTVAEDVAQVARDTRSARMRRELLALRVPMRPWQGQPAGRRLRDILAAVSRPN